MLLPPNISGSSPMLAPQLRRELKSYTQRPRPTRAAVVSKSMSEMIAKVGACISSLAHQVVALRRSALLVHC